MPLLKQQFDFVENNYKKLLGLAQQGVQAVDKAIDENIPGGEQFTERWATGAQRIGSFVQGELDAADRQVDEPIDHVGDIPYFLFGAYRRGAQQYTNNARNLATQMGVDPRAGNVLGMAAEGIAEVGLGGLGKAASSITPPGPGLKPAMVGAGSAVPTPGVVTPSKGGPVMEAVTATDPEVLSKVGVQTGADLMDKTQGKRYIRRNKLIQKSEASIETLNDQIGSLMELKGDTKNLTKYLDNNPELKDLYGRYAGRKDQFEKTINRLREQRKNAQETLSRQQSNVLPEDVDNPFFFRTTKGIAAKKAQEIKEGVTGYLEQHHLFPKGASAAFMGKMDELISKGVAEADDLVLMAQYAKKRGMEAGDYKANMLNMRTIPHNEMHTVLRELGEEPSKSFLQNQLKDVKSVDELLVKWKEFLDDTASYNIETAKTWEPLDNLLKELRSK